MARTTINVPITGDARPLRGALGDADGALGSFESGAGSKLANIGRMIAGAFVVSAVVDFGREMLTLGAQIETLNVKIDTVFGDQADDVRAWADGVNESFGVTDTQLAGMAAGMADLLKPMGFTSEQAATMSRESLELAGALSAWSGGTRTTAEVSEILSSALLGEYEQLKSLGISIDAAEVQTRALALAQAEGRTEVTAMDEALAVQQLILEKSTDAQIAWNSGQMDAIKTQNELAAAFAEVKESLAEALYPIMIRVGQWIVQSLIPWIRDELVPTLRLWWKWIQENIVPAMLGIWKVISQSVLPALADFVSFMYVGILGSIGAFKLAWDKLFIPGWQLLEMILGNVIKLLDTVKQKIDDLLGPIDEFVTAVGSGVLNAVGGAVGGSGGFQRALPGFGLGSGIPRLASGGIVTAPTLALIAEAGPEAVVPLSGRNGGMGGNVYSISVSSIDPASAGRVVVDAIREYERSNGRAWREAS